jgi:hypothetical protein
MIEKIVSGGQTGADRAALDVAIKLGIPYSGWVPKGREAEDGPLPDTYHMKEMPVTSYPKRTEQNVIDSDGTLIVSHGKLTGGSKLTMQLAKQYSRPWIHIDLKNTPYSDGARMIQEWARGNMIETLNVAGPRASKDPLIYDAVRELLEITLSGSNRI